VRKTATFVRSSIESKLAEVRGSVPRASIDASTPRLAVIC
jgi:hypothetical protein